MENSRSPRAFLLLARVFIGGLNDGHNPDAVFTFGDYSPKCPPSVKGENILAGLYILGRDSLSGETVQYEAIIRP